MFKEGLLDKILRLIKRIIPVGIFHFFQPYYHTALAYAGAALYGFPSRSLRVIGVTGTKGKSTTVFLIAKLLEEALRQTQGNAHGVAAIGSLGYKIKEREWPNMLKMTMPGRFKLQKFLKEALRAGCQYVVLEVTSEGIKQKRHLGIQFDCAVFTNIHKEHIETHGSFENYMAAKQELFARTENIHVINADDPHADQFGKFSARHKIFFGLQAGDMVAHNVQTSGAASSFELYGTPFSLRLGGLFNVYNALAALATTAMYGIDLPTAAPILKRIKSIPGRMEYIQREPFAVVVDYAHTPDSLRSVYKTLKQELNTPSTWLGASTQNRKLFCVLGAAGGGRDKWKRPEFGKIAAEYCNEIILTNEDPYDENPEAILEEIAFGLSQIQNSKSLSANTARQGSRAGESQNEKPRIFKILDRREAIKKAISDARPGDTVVITGKGSETSMALAGGKKISWSDTKVVRDILSESKPTKPY